MEVNKFTTKRVKIRQFPESNYKAFWFNGKTIRVAIDPKKPITELQYPEFYDIKITGYCEGNCSWCYMSSSKEQFHYEHAVEKIKTYFSKMTTNQRPFQIAIAGGEPTSHPKFIELLKTFKDLGIEPNYTTNGMWLHTTEGMWINTEKEKELLSYSKELCGGVAVSCHPHLKQYWETAAKKYISYNVPLNFHIIISDRDSIDYFIDLYEKWSNTIDYFVLLPYMSQGRAVKKDIDWGYLVQKMPVNTHKIAFGAGFYSYLLEGNHNIEVSLYEPEIMSRFISLKGTGKIYLSSFSNVIIKDNLF